MKKVLSLILAVLMIFSVSVCAFATEEENKAEFTDHDPVVLVRGMDFGGVKLDPGTENERSANDFSVGTILPAAFKALSQWLILQKKDAAVDTVIDCAYEMLKYNSMDENGDPAYNTGMIKYDLSADHYPQFFEETKNEVGMVHTFVETFGKKHVYYVNYDWRVDPFIVADEIDSAVKLAIEKTGHSKVNIVCASMGGIMTVAYLTKYGYDNIGRCIFLSSTFCGSQIVCDVLTGKVEIKPERLYEYLLSVVSGNTAGELAIKALNKAGVFGLLTKITDYILENKKSDMYERVLIPIFGYSPAVWGLVSEDVYEDAINYTFGSRDNLNETFLNRIDALQKMMKDKTALLNKMVDDGVKVSVVSNYGSPLIPVYESASFTGDRTLEAYNTSGLATIAKYGETLGDDYKAADPSLVSPDNCVDLSTAVLPEYTYMIKYAPHVATSYGTDYSDFVVYLLKNTGDFKAGSNEKYPRFMVSDLNEQTLRPFGEND